VAAVALLAVEVIHAGALVARKSPRLVMGHESSHVNSWVAFLSTLPKVDSEEQTAAAAGFGELGEEPRSYKFLTEEINGTAVGSAKTSRRRFSKGERTMSSWVDTGCAC
jgi:hypothetical protein